MEIDQCVSFRREEMGQGDVKDGSFYYLDNPEHLLILIKNNNF